MRGLSAWSRPSARRLLPATGGLVLALILAVSPASAAGVAPHRIGSLDCNHLSTIQKSVKIFLACADVHNLSQPDHRLSDNGTYIGHDEPTLNFVSNVPGSGNDTTWTFTLGRDPAALPTISTPGKDISHYFELTPALWFSMNLCDPQSYPLNPCTPKSDANAPAAECLAVFPCHGFLGGGSAFMELQFYPPGFGPWAVAPSFDNTHWGAALTVDSFEAKPFFTDINPGCTEPINFAFIQRNGVPPGPPSPQLSTLASSTPNSETLLMNPGDTIRVHMFDAGAPGGGNALETRVEDLTTGQSGFMQASAANGFMNTNVTTCAGTPFNYEPAYSTAAAGNISTWGVGTQVISAAFELGHFVPCTSLGDPGVLPLAPDVSDTYYNRCNGPYEQTVSGGDGRDTVELSDALCFPAGDEHGGLAAGFPDLLTGCQDTFTQNGDLDYDGSSYWPEWPDSTTPTSHPASFQIKPPTTVGSRTYSAFQLQTDLPFTEVTTCNPTTPGGCTVPPPNAPGKFYPYWTLTSSTTSAATTCNWEFGNMTNGNTFGGPSQYGSFNATAPVDAPDLASPFFANRCTA